MKCPACGFGYCYAPLLGGGYECVNSSCKHFSSKHYLAMKDQINKKPKETGSQTYFDFDDLDFSGFSQGSEEEETTNRYTFSGSVPRK